MTRAYLRLDPLYDEHKAAYPDGPYAAFIACLCLGESQPERGRFRNERYLRALLDRRGRHVAYLLQHGDLTILDDGRVYIVGWDEWQEGDWKVTERVQRIRARKHGDVSPDVTVDVTVDVTPDVTVPVTADRKAVSGKRYAVSGAVGDDPDCIDLYYQLTTRPPSKTVIDWLDRLADEHGPESVMEVMSSEWQTSPLIQDFLGRVQTSLAVKTRRESKDAAAERARSEAEYQRQERERIDAMPPEQRAANLQRLGEMMRERGLVS